MQLYITNMENQNNEESGVVIFLKAHWGKLLMGLAFVVVLIIVLIAFNSSEYMQDQFVLTQLAAENADPVYFKYTGRDKDVLGMSAEDYYYNNLTFANSRAADQLLEGNTAFVNQTDYLDMPPQYRPKPLSGFIGQSGNVVAAESSY
jgi:hypothetical protein